MHRGRNRNRHRRGFTGTLATLLPGPIFIFTIVIGLGFVGAGTAYAFFSRDLPSAADFARDPLPLSTKVLARDGQTVLYVFAEEQREPVRYEELPQRLIDATVAAEDKTFWTNRGVDVLGIGRAVFYDLFRRGGERPQGASTITQQLVKLRLVGSELSVTRKIKEFLVALDVARTYSKKEILSLYFNQVYFGNQAYGVKAAALAYFGTNDLGGLTLGQVALLAGLPQAPSDLDPSKEENRPAAAARRAYVLGQMVENGYITETEAEAAAGEPIEIAGRRVIDIRAPHFVFQVKRQLATIIGEAAITRGGYSVITTLDLPKQTEAEKQVSGWVEQLHSRSVWNAALVTIDPKTGEVLAYVGSVDYTNTEDPRVKGNFDVAGLGERQPGSAFKVFTYLTALKNGATPATVVVDARTDFTGKDTTGAFRNCVKPGPTAGYCPENADLQYHGPLTMRQAIRESRNVPAVKFLHHYAGIAATVDTAREMGITTDLVGPRPELSLALGSVPVKLLDMTSAYGVLANMGTRVEPTFVLKVTDPEGRTVWEHVDYEKRRVLSTEIAWLMTDILKDTTDPAKSFIFGSWTNIGRIAALKTGTTDNLKDVYSVGYTPQAVTGVWMGNNDGTLMDQRDFFSAMGPGQLWREYMKAIHKDLPVQDWPRPAGIVSAQIVSAPSAFGGYGSGLKPSSLTPFAVSENFIRGSVPTKQDDWFQVGCPGETGSRRVALVLNESGPDSWTRYRDLWVDQALGGKHNYNRYNWPSLLQKAGPCPTPSSPTPTPFDPFWPAPTPSPSPRFSLPPPTPQP